MTYYARYFKKKVDELADDQKQRRRKRTEDPRFRLVDEVADLRADLGRTVLLLEAIVDACISKEVLNESELQTFLENADWRDGTMDGKLDPSQMRSTTPREQSVSQSTEEYLKRLEESDHP
ncbi:MAG: hypothetical protein MI757_03365 [Pirellulales bacterium]|nr:hypothetical protein [Pirellulales bacterium]